MGVSPNWIRPFGSNEKIEGSSPSTPINIYRKILATNSMVECRPVKSEVQGSNPWWPAKLRGVAQPGSALVLGTSSRRFKSFHPDQINVLVAEWSIAPDCRSGL